MIGCSFVVDREYFGEIGLLDPGMEVYGGENIELGMRVSFLSLHYPHSMSEKCITTGTLFCQQKHMMIKRNTQRKTA